MQPNDDPSGLPPIAPTLPDYGTFPRTPANGDDWIHPDDRELIRGLIPGERVFRRDRFADGYFHFCYGEVKFRLRPCLWLPLVGEGLDIGDRVETIGLAMKRELFVSHIVGMIYSAEEGRIRYQLARTPTSELDYLAEDLRLLTDKTELRPRVEFEPPPRWTEITPETLAAAAEELRLADQEPDDRSDQ